MGMDVTVTITPGVAVQLSAVRRRALVEAGHLILGLSSADAPYLTDAMIESGHVELELTGEGDDRVAIAYREFYAQWQEEKLEYKHTHGGPLFLEKGMVVGTVSALELIAARMSEAING